MFRKIVFTLGAAILAGAALYFFDFDGSDEFDSPAGSPGSRAADGALPGIGVFNDDLLERFREMRERRGRDYRPRTKHLDADGRAQYTNRLFLETSPYLLQHAHNPVNWYPWGDEAFARARELNRPVLLSVGYSTCHWCHVMEEESFEDLEIAEFMNRNYIAVKVDREERPDVDAIYMSALQAMTGRGGWPMTVWLAPDRRPFYGAVYIPARDGDRGVRYGFLSMLRGLKKSYDRDPEKIARAGEETNKLITKALTPRGVSRQKLAGGDRAEAALLHRAAEHYKERFDPVYGGMSGAPKFPSSLPVRFLLRYHRRTGDRKALKAALLSLKKMAAGGIYDHVGGGFHRYSTDERWLVPHFEKMLYDNALLAMAYLEAYQATGDPNFERVTREILRYVKRDKTSPAGAFYSATDADSLTPEGHREEGRFFTWTGAEIDRALGAADARLVKRYFSVRRPGNFEGRSILHTPAPLARAAGALRLSESRARKKIEAGLNELYAVRENRPPPIRDEKILTAWNGLMISAFARAGLILNEPAYVDRARGAADFLLKNLYKRGRLFRSYKDGRARHNAFLEDHAFLIAGLLDLYEATADIRWMTTALALDRTLQERFEDEEQGGFFRTAHDHEKLLAREKPAYDGAEPSGNSVAALNLLRLHAFTTDDSFRVRANKTLRAFAVLDSNPAVLSEMLLAVDFHLDRAREIIIVRPRNGSAEELLNVFRGRFLPNRVLLVVEEGAELRRHQKLVPPVGGKFARNGKPLAFVCENGICQKPTDDPVEFGRQIAEVEPLNR